MIANRPDWTLSRQRQWGVPLPFFVHKETGELHPRHAGAARAGRANASSRAASRRGRARRSEDCSASTTRAYTQDAPTPSTSGSTPARRTRRAARPDGRTAPDRIAATGFPADLYLEGSDQHRGWFHSSLLIVVHAERRAAVQGAADARLHGRRQGRKMTKSLGNVVAPQKVVEHARRRDPAPVGRGDRLLGRAGDLRRDPEARRRELPPHPQHAALPARQHRATSIPRRDARAASPSCSRSTATRSARRARWPRRSRRDYARYEFHLVVQRLQTYLLRGPRRLLPRHPEGPAVHDGADEPRAPLGADGAVRRSATRCCADGADPVVHRRGGVADRAARTIATIFVQTWDGRCPRVAGRRRAGCASGTRILAVRAAVQKELEDAAPGRRDRLVAAGRSRRSRAGADDYAALASLGDDLRFVLITSAARVDRAATRWRSTSTPSAHAEVRALLALARRRRRRSGASDALRPLRREPVRRRRAAHVRLTARDRLTRSRFARIAMALRWLWLALAVIVARPGDQGAAMLAAFRAGRGAAADAVLQPRARVQHRRRVQLPRRRRRLAALALRGDRASPRACVIVWLLRRGGSALFCAGLALILGGALGNVIDRADARPRRRLPARSTTRGWYFPAFNVADSAITVGAGAADPRQLPRAATRPVAARRKDR